MTPIYTLKRVPGATEPVEWTDICHRPGPCVVINYEAYYPKGRWNHGTRKRPFAVCWSSNKPSLHPFSYHVTLEAAHKAARKLAQK